MTWSPGIFEIYGLPPTPGCNLETAQQRCYAKDRVAVEQAIQRSFTGGEPYNADYRIVHPIDESDGYTPLAALSMTARTILKRCADLPGTSPGSLGTGSPVSRGPH